MKPEIGAELFYVAEQSFGRHSKSAVLQPVIVVKHGRDYFYVAHKAAHQREAEQLAAGNPVRKPTKPLKVDYAGWRLKDEYSSGGLYLSEAHYHERQKDIRAYRHLTSLLVREVPPLNFRAGAAAVLLQDMGFDTASARLILQKLKEHLHKA